MSHPGHSRRSSAICLTLSIVALIALPCAASLLRFPDVHGDIVVFVHGEDLWTVPAAGGVARRLTDDEGEERHPKLSPDGELIAFTAEIDGNPDVYVMPTAGGAITRLTFHPAADEVVGWHPATGKVLFRSRRSSFSRFDRLFLIAADGGGLEVLPLHEAGRGSFSPDGARIAYNRIAREDRTWKRYHGGMAQDLWLYEFSTATDRRLTDYSGSDRLPMWVGDTIYFASDRDRTLNIYAYGLADGHIERITDHRDYDVRRPSEGGQLIVYEVGGDLWLLDTRTRQTRRIPVQIPVEPRETRPYRRDVADEITSVDCAPDGGRVALAARGELFTVPAEHGPTRNLTGSPGARERDPVWSPDGDRIAYLSDASGEPEIWVVDAQGGEPERLTALGPGFRHTLRWAPGGRHIAFADHTLSVLILDLETRAVTRVDTSDNEPMDVALDAKPISDFVWSPDGRFLAYSKIGPDLVSNIWVYSLDDGERHNLSSGLFNDFGPVFTRDGEHLLLVSNRRFSPTFCDFEWEMVYKDVAGVYAITLRRGGRPLLGLRSDESAPAEGDDEWPPTGRREDDDREPVTVRIDLDGITERIEALPVEASNYRELAVTDDEVLYLDGEHGDFNRFEYRELPPRDLEAFSFSDRIERTIARGVIDYSLSANGSHVAYRTRSGVVVEKLRRAGSMGRMMQSVGGERSDDGHAETLDLSNLVTVVDPRAEWRQVFDEAWRMERDFFYDPNLHGLDWPAMKDKYGRLLDRASCVQDVRFVIGELIGELATSHTYVRLGDRRRDAEEVEVGLLGADWEIDPAVNLHRLAKVYRVPDWSRGVDPPLTGPGIDVREGDYLLAVNGQPVTGEREVSAWFQGLAGVQVRLLLNDRPEKQGAREITVVPVASERYLRYLDWVEHNRRVVDEASGGRIGYIHLPDTYVGSATELPKYYYSQSLKEGLIVDGRFNGGGLDPDIFLQRLAKKPLSYWTRRYSADQVTPVYANRAHLVCLTNRQAGSGGDELPHEFRQKGMGPVIGTRTWGGLVGVSMFIPLMDGSGLTAPDYRIYTPDGRWTVENEGVTPDIVVELDPAEMARGWDAQLQKGIEVLLQRIEEEPRAAPEHPPFL